jgi:hypothetical protein
MRPNNTKNTHKINLTEKLQHVFYCFHIGNVKHTQPLNREEIYASGIFCCP